MTRDSTSAGVVTGSWPTSTITSPGCTPFSAAAPSGATSLTSTPVTSSAMPNSARAAAVSGRRLRPTAASAVSVVCSSGPAATGRPWSSSSSSPMVTFSVWVLPLRKTTTRTVLSTGVSATSRGRSRISSTSLPSNLVMTSPASIPATAAGPSGVTSATSAPRGRSMPSASASSSFTVWMRTPSQPRRAMPNSCSWLTTLAARFEGTAKPMPMDPPVGETMAVFTPITSPSMLKSGPPELPRLIAASVCRKSS